MGEIKDRELYEAIQSSDVASLQDLFRQKNYTNVNAIVLQEQFPNRTSAHYTPLMLACKEGKLEIANFLFGSPDLKGIVDISKTTEIGSDAFFLAALCGHEDIVSSFLKIIAEDNRLGIPTFDFNKQRSDGFNPLMIASARGHGGIAKMLIEAGANANLVDDNLKTAWIMAAKNNHIDIALDIIKHGNINANALSHKENPVLIWAASEGYTEIVDALIDAGAYINDVDEQGATALIKAAKEGHAETVKTLLKKGAGIRSDEACLSPLMLAASRGLTEMTSRIMDQGANVDLQNADSKTAWILAAENNHVETAINIIKNSNANALGPIEHEPVLTWAVCHNYDVRIIKALLENGAKINATDKNYDTALIKAAENGYTEIVEILLKNGADTSCENDKALTLAVQNGHEETSSILKNAGLKKAVRNNDVQNIIRFREMGADVNQTDKDGMTLLMSAIYESYYASAVELAKHANVDAASTIGNTALMLSAATGQVEVVKTLLERGADINAKNHSNKMAFEIADLAKQEAPNIINLKNLKARYKNCDEIISMINNAHFRRAASEGKVEAATFFLEWRDAAIDSLDQNGSTSLILAAANGHEEMVKMLMGRGANTTITNNDGRTATTIANENGHAQISQLIETFDIKDYVPPRIVRDRDNSTTADKIKKLIQPQQKNPNPEPLNPPTKRRKLPTSNNLENSSNNLPTPSVTAANLGTFSSSSKDREIC